MSDQRFLTEFARMAETDLPWCRKVGRYAFFAICAFGFGAIATMPLLGLGFKRELAHGLANIASIAAFLALRDMSKAWDFALRSTAIAIEAAEADETRSGSAEGESAGRRHRPTPIPSPKEE